MRRAPAALLTLAALSLAASADELNGLRNSVAPTGDLDGDGVPGFALALLRTVDLAPDSKALAEEPRGDGGR